MKGSGFKIYDRENRQIVIQADNAELDNLTFGAGELATMNVAINFLTQELDEQANYDYRVMQVNSGDHTVVSGETYTVARPARTDFAADAGNDKTIIEGQSAALSAASIGEQATYNWYDTNDSLVYTGQDWTVSPEKTTQYKLEVIAAEDGFKDYDAVAVKVKENYITGLSPNPASSNVSISYKLADDVTAAYVIVMRPYGSSNHYVLNTTGNSQIIDLAAYSPGTYTVVLVCNGILTDTKTIIKN
jgi:hypothetical protein